MDWESRTLGELCELRGGTVFKTAYQGNSTGKYPFIKVSDMNQPENTIFIRKAVNWIEDDVKKIIRAKVHPPESVIFAKIGIALTFNRRRILLQDTVIDNNLMCAIPKPSRVSPLFFYYLLCTIDFNIYSQGTALPYLTVGIIKLIPLNVPHLPEQRAIANILGTLDDKIDLNRRMNQTLEGMAQALFKSWFVDFDGHDDLVESELGPIPRGWEVGTLEEMLTLQRGFDLPLKRRTQGLYPVITAGGIHGSHNEAKVVGPGIVTGRSGKLGDVYLVQEDFWPLNTTLWVKSYARSKLYYAYHLLRILHLERFNAGSAVPTLNRNHIRNLPIPIPPAARIEKYEATVSSMFHKRQSNQDEIDNLASLRDTLLPKLISGELRVPDAEKIMEVAS